MIPVRRDSRYHTFCVHLDAVPEGDWYCDRPQRSCCSDCFMLETIHEHQASDVRCKQNRVVPGSKLWDPKMAPGYQEVHQNSSKSLLDLIGTQRSWQPLTTNWLISSSLSMSDVLKIKTCQVRSVCSSSAAQATRDHSWVCFSLLGVSDCVLQQI